MPANDIVINATFLQVLIYSILIIFAIYLIVKIIPALTWRLITIRANKCNLNRIKKIELAMAGEDPIQESVSAIRGIHTYKLFILYLRDGQVSRAERMLQTAMLETQSVYVFSQAIDYYKSAGNTQQVKKIYEILLQRKRKNTKFHSRYASFLVSIEEYHEALLHYHICLYKHRYNNLCKNQIGYCYLQLGEYERALTYLKKILSFDESDRAPFYNAAECYFYLKDYPNAIKLFDRVPKKMRDCGYFCFLSRIQIILGDYEAAKLSLVSAVKLTQEADIETTLSAIGFLFNEYSQKDMYADIISFCSALRKAWDSVNDGDEDSFENGDEDSVDDGGEDSADDGDEDSVDDGGEDSVDVYKRWLDFLEYWRLSGIVHSDDSKDFSAAGRSLSKLILENPEDHELLYLNAVYCKKSGRHIEAVQIIKKAIFFEKNTPLYFISLSNYLTDICDYTGSLHALEDGIFYNSDELSLYLELAAKLTILCDYDKAGRIFNRLIELSPDNKDILESLAFFYLSQSKWEEAEQYHNKFKALAPDSENTEIFEEEITRLKKPVRESLAEFIKTTYYYLNESGKKAIEEFGIKSGVPSAQEVKSLFDGVIQPQDTYSFILADEEYKTYLSMNSKNYVWPEYINQDVLRIRIEQFAVHTYIHFSDELYAVSDTINKRLVLDLRSNTGGSMESAMKIADILTPKCKLAALYDRDGNIMAEYESADHQIKFKQIYILIDEDTASASEALALILKKRLDNVTILGSKSYGKNVGLCSFEIRELSCLLMLCGNTLSIDGTAVGKDGILPDIQIGKEDDWTEYVTERQTDV